MLAGVDEDVPSSGSRAPSAAMNGAIFMKFGRAPTTAKVRMEFRRAQFAPLLCRTAGIVRRISRTSLHSDQFVTYR